MKKDSKIFSDLGMFLGPLNVSNLHCKTAYKIHRLSFRGWGSLNPYKFERVPYGTLLRGPGRANGVAVSESRMSPVF